MLILDSNIWIAYLNESDSQHAKAQKIFEALDLPLGISEYIMIEVSTVLAAKASPEIAASFLEMASDNRDISIILSDADFFARCQKRFTAAKSRKLSFIDVSLIELSQEHKVLSFDSDLARELAK